MLVFHALARMGAEGLVIVSPATPLVSIGYFQDAEAEVDLDYCQKSGIPYMRRELGGGATYLDENQVFYQFLWQRDSRRFPPEVRRIMEIFSEPAVRAYEDLGVKAEFRPQNDIITPEGRKIAGQAAGDIEGMNVFVGGILLDFDIDTMTRVLKVPDEKFRDKLHKTMSQALSTVKRETGVIPPRRAVVESLVKHFGKIVKNLEPAEMNRALLTKMAEVEAFLGSDDFLFYKKTKPLKSVKIQDGLDMVYGLYKAPGGLIRSAQVVRRGGRGGVIEEVGLSGDFQVYPKAGLEGLERTLERTIRLERDITERVRDFYLKTGVQVPGVEPADVTKSILDISTGADAKGNP